MPTLHSLLNLHPEGIISLSATTPKAIPFRNHFNAHLISEKSDLVAKVATLVETGRREREHASAQYEEPEIEPELEFSDSGGHRINVDKPEEQVEVYPLRQTLTWLQIRSARASASSSKTKMRTLPSLIAARVGLQGVAAARTLSSPLPGNVYAGLALSQKLAHYAFARPNSPSQYHFIPYRLLWY
ncbi:hypothetical protein FIBSPDRAFT_966975 [Athelia psychrophila]|uniref:Uncharacterized protein n=1 Tax=Athelia psychrophila TaxID=1759441 RepID=A0A167W7U8_9AGAM|nr:hypothetical protein FIBSPDRAFT_966975 [Fibularhizoctonia sp. CBS 109695]